MGNFSTTVIVKASDVGLAIGRAAERDSDWQAQYCEVAMIPEVAQRWAEANPRFTGLQVQRVDGIAHRGDGFTREQNIARGEASGWDVVNGYTLVFNEWSRWNSVRSDCYSHSSGSTMDGIRRETRYSLFDLVISAFRSLRDGNERGLRNARLELLSDWDVEFEDDLLDT